jgi:hypothetical protein
MEVRELPAPTDGKGRVETGATRFGDDWPGVFIRGDNAMYYAMVLDVLVKAAQGKDIIPSIYHGVLAGLVDDLKSCDMSRLD